jgi:hypothetical protein
MVRGGAATVVSPRRARLDWDGAEQCRPCQGFWGCEGSASGPSRTRLIKAGPFGPEESSLRVLGSGSLLSSAT